MVRAKKNLQFKLIKRKRRLHKNVFSDTTVELNRFYPGKYYPDNLRLGRFWDEEQSREFTFLTNNFSLISLQVANLSVLRNRL